MMPKLKPWFPALFWMAAIYHFSSQQKPLRDLPSKVPYLPWEKCAHFAEYAGLYYWVYKAVSDSTEVHKVPQTKLMSFFITLFYALSDELHQHTVPGRKFEFSDLRIDIIGMLFASVFLR
jgi:VanZ family protein